MRIMFIVIYKFNGEFNERSYNLLQIRYMTEADCTFDVRNNKHYWLVDTPRLIFLIFTLCLVTNSDSNQTPVNTG